MIVRNAEKTLARCLDSLKGHVDQIVIVLGGESTDKTEAIARQYTSEVHSFAWVDDFAAARNYAYSFLKTDWALWVDADDVMDNADRLRSYVASLDGDIGAVLMPYHYAFDGFGNCTTVVDRKRLTRSVLGWKWRDRVHEDIIESSGTRYVRTTDIAVRHQHDGYSDKSGERNLRLLLMSHEEEPDNVRHWKYLGFQYFAMADWRNALRWMLKFSGDPRGVMIERWQQLCYCSKAAREIGDYDQAIKMANAAIIMLPHLSQGYLEMGRSLAAKNDWDRAAYWTKEGMQKEPASTLSFFNPLEQYVQPHETLYQCYWHTGDVDRAIHHAQEAYRALPSPVIKANLEEFIAHKKKYIAADAFLEVAKDLTPYEAESVARRMGGITEAVAVRDTYVVPMLDVRGRLHGQRIIFFAGGQVEPWSPATIARTGIGGSETALYEIARRFAADGWLVDLFAAPGRDEGVIDGIGWWDASRYRAEMQADVLVGWRDPTMFAVPHAAKRNLLWLHDLNYGPRLTEASTRHANAILGVSAWHADYLSAQYPAIAGRVGFVPNGINLERFAGSVQRQRGKVVWASAPDRGLEHLLALWHSNIVNLAIEPKPELHIFYGWETTDAAIRMGHRHLAEMKDRILKRLDHPTIHWRGRMPQDELAKEFLSAEMWLYPTDFLETSCITAMEAMAAGLVCITSQAGALPHTLGDAGLCVPGRPHSVGFLNQFMGVTYAALLDQKPDGIEETLKERARRIGPERAKTLSWDASYKDCWLQQVNAEVAAR